MRVYRRLFVRPFWFRKKQPPHSGHGASRPGHAPLGSDRVGGRRFAWSAKYTRRAFGGQVAHKAHSGNATFVLAPG